MSPADEPMPRLGGVEGGSLWERSRRRCPACGSEGLLDEGNLRVKERPGSVVEWVGPSSSDRFHFGFATDSEALPLRARRCRECRHVVFFAEDED